MTAFYGKILREDSVFVKSRDFVIPLILLLLYTINEK